jgi:hypothetical protein
MIGAGAGGDFGAGGGSGASSGAGGGAGATTTPSLTDLSGFENPFEETQKSIDNAKQWQGQMSTRGHVLRGVVR